ncbi:MAG: glycerol-3-phosphate 1-O-acyltransferase PlsY [Pseudomonadota bacterium]
MTDIVIKLAISYALGSIMGSLLLGKLRRVDIRSMGSGNAGGTNALRTQGVAFALGVIVIDIGKGALAAGWVPELALFGGSPSPDWLPYACGAAAVFGHCFPVFFGFRGGKGAATLVGTLLVFDAVLFPPLLAFFIIVIMLFGYVGLSTMLTANMATAVVLWKYGTSNPEFLVYTVIMGIAMVATHHENIKRMLAGTESQNRKLMVFRK